MAKHIDHAGYQKSLRDKSVDSLYFIMRDASEAAQALPMGENAGYYLDEVHYVAMELQRRRMG